MRVFCPYSTGSISSMRVLTAKILPSIGGSRSSEPRNTWKYGQYPQYRTPKSCEYSQHEQCRTLTYCRYFYPTCFTSVYPPLLGTSAPKMDLIVGPQCRGRLLCCVGFVLGLVWLRRRPRLSVYFVSYGQKGMPLLISLASSKDKSCINSEKWESGSIS